VLANTHPQTKNIQTLYHVVCNNCQWRKRSCHTNCSQVHSCLAV